jgi:hypothetical protein
MTTLECKICSEEVADSKWVAHMKTEEHKLKHMKKLIAAHKPLAEESSDEEYTIMEVDVHDPRFNGLSIAADTSDPSFDPNYPRRVYTYQDIVSLLSKPLPVA